MQNFKTEPLEQSKDLENVTIEKRDLENLQYLLVQSGQDNEKLKVSIKEWTK